MISTGEKPTHAGDKLTHERHAGGKPNHKTHMYTHESEKDIYICIDMSSANEVIMRERFPIPTLNGVKGFNKIDKQSGVSGDTRNEHDRSRCVLTVLERAHITFPRNNFL